jgi:hypothetical protein
MEIQRLFFIIADISGYTRFVTLHRQTLLHAEKIIGNLLESVMSEARDPLYVHELLGDAVTVYAPANGTTHAEIYATMHRMHQAFTKMEADHISSCSLCSCDACSNVGKLSLKIIAHQGEAAFSTVGGIKKISGEEVILTHRWLKNSIPSHEYLLFTEAFASGLDNEIQTALSKHAEHLEGLGTKTAYYQDLSGETPPSPASGIRKLLRHTQLSIHAIGRRFGMKSKEFRNIPTA